VAQLLADHHLVVAPYRDATQSGIVPLAQAAGRPSVVTPVGGLARQITDGLDGVVAEGVDSQSISRAIVRAAARLDALAAGAADAAPKWSAFADAVSDLVDAVLEQRGASGDARQSGLR
jgi:glycosyltransferase involved in cell wall biosynthesis